MGMVPVLPWAKAQRLKDIELEAARPPNQRASGDAPDRITNVEMQGDAPGNGPGDPGVPKRQRVSRVLKWFAE